MIKKYFFFDIDGTLTDRTTKKIVPSAQQALNLLQQTGHFTAIATGRAHYKARSFMEDIGLHHMVCNGGNALVVNDQLLHNQPLPRKKAIALYEEASSLGYGVLAMIDDSENVYSHQDTFRFQCREGRKEPTIYNIDKNFQIRKVPEIFKLYIAIPEAEEYRLHHLQTLGHLRFEPPYLMIQHDHKKEGILEMIQEIHGSVEDVVVFGDDVNDIVMFDQRWFSIAMGNACDALKQKADFITKNNVEDGIWYACKHFHWI